MLREEETLQMQSTDKIDSDNDSDLPGHIPWLQTASLMYSIIALTSSFSVVLIIITCKLFDVNIPKPGYENYFSSYFLIFNVGYCLWSLLYNHDFWTVMLILLTIFTECSVKPNYFDLSQYIFTIVLISFVKINRTKLSNLRDTYARECNVELEKLFTFDWRNGIFSIKFLSMMKLFIYSILLTMIVPSLYLQIFSQDFWSIITVFTVLFMNIYMNSYYDDTITIAIIKSIKMSIIILTHTWFKISFSDEL